MTVKQHDGKDDEQGKRIESVRVQATQKERLYSVDAGQLIRVNLKNLSLTRSLTFRPVYVSDTGDEDPEDVVTLKSSEVRVRVRFARARALSLPLPPPPLSLPLSFSPLTSLSLSFSYWDSRVEHAKFATSNTATQH